MKKKSIAKNYVYNLIYQMLTIFLPLITTPYLSRVLGAEQIGIYGYTCSIVTYFILFGTFTFACEFLFLDPQGTWPHVHQPELLLHGRALLSCPVTDLGEVSLDRVSACRFR